MIAALLPFWQLTGWRFIAGMAFAIPPSLLVGQCSGARNERTEIKAENARIAAAAERIGRAADRLHQTRVEASTATISEDRKALDNETAHIPDQALTARQRARVCHELRRSDPEAAAPSCGPAPARPGTGDAR